MIKASFIQEAVVSRLCASMTVADVLSWHFGPKFTTAKVTFGGPNVYVAAINRTSDSVEYKAIKRDLGFLRSLAHQPPPPQSQHVFSCNADGHGNGIGVQGGPN
jgi:hypothetical protein